MKPACVTLLLSGLLSTPVLMAAMPVPVVEMTPGATLSATTIQPSAQPAPVPPHVVQARAEAGRYTQLFLQIQQLQEEVGYLRGQVEEQRYDMKRMRDDARDRYRDLDRRLSNLSQAATPVPEAAAPVVGSLPFLADQAAPEAIPAPRLGDQKAYEDAFALVRQKSFDQAVASFERFLTLYPASKLLPNVYYWTGEVHRAKNPPDPAAAKDAFSQVVQRFPEHAKAADAYYKLALTFVDLGDRAKAAETMNIVLTRYPDAASARLAADFLARN